MGDHQHWSVLFPVPGYPFQSFRSWNLPCLVNSCIYNAAFVVPFDKHVFQFRKSLLSVFREGAYPDYSEGQAVRDVVGDMGWVAGGGEEVLAAVSGLPVEVCYDFAIFDCAQSVQEGDAFRWFTFASSFTIITCETIHTSVLHGKLDAAVNLVDLVQELMSTLAGTFDDEVDVIKEPFVELDFEFVLIFLSYFQDLLVNPCHEDIGIVWSWFTAHTGADVLLVQLVIKYEQVILHDQLEKLDDHKHTPLLNESLVVC